MILLRATKRENLSFADSPSVNWAKIRNAAWQFLLDNNIDKLPIDPYKIASDLKISLVGYKSVKDYQVTETLDERTLGAIFADESNLNDIYLFYSTTAPTDIMQFTIAHELGHYALNHLLTPQADLTLEEYKRMDKEANMFAARILMPIGVLHELHVTSAKQIADICQVSLKAALYRYDRLLELNKRGLYGSHPLERQVIHNFEKFIAENKKK